jgi:hypothetical protein
MVEACDQGVQIPSAQYPPKKVEKYLKLQLKSLAAQALLPGQGSAERTAKRHELRTQCLAILDGVQADMKRRIRADGGYSQTHSRSPSGFSSPDCDQRRVGYNVHVSRLEGRQERQLMI